MKRLTKSLAASALAAVLLLGLVAVPALAYFTASDWASGDVTIKGPSTDIGEEVGAGQKDVTILNNEDSVPVWVRARPFAASELETTVYSGTDEQGNELWTEAGDGWWTYNEIVNPGESTEPPLTVSITWPFMAEDVGDDGIIISDTGGESGGVTELTANVAKGTNYNIVVVYEAQPVRYDADGNPLPADWS